MDCLLLWAYKMSYCVVWAVLLDCCTREQWWALVFLPKRAWSRQGEINRGSPKLLHANSRSCDPHSFWVSDHLAQARGVSLKGDPAWGYYSPFSSPRLGEGGSPERDPSAWARSWAREVWCLVISCSWMVGTCLDIIVMVKYMMNGDVWVMWFMDGKWWECVILACETNEMVDI